MKRIKLCLLAILILDIFGSDQPTDADLPVPSGLAKSPAKSAGVPEYLNIFEDCFPTLTTPSANKAKCDLFARIDRLYGRRLKTCPDFYRLIKPLIKIGKDPAEYHMDFVMSDYRVAFLHVYAEKSDDHVFTYDEALLKLRTQKGQERYNLFMFCMSSFSRPISFSKIVWKDIFTLSEFQYVVLSGVVGLFDKYPNLKIDYMQSVIAEMFLGKSVSRWNPAYWKQRIRNLSVLNDSEM